MNRAEEELLEVDFVTGKDRVSFRDSKSARVVPVRLAMSDLNFHGSDSNYVCSWPFAWHNYMSLIGPVLARSCTYYLMHKLNGIIK
jgi:hypothetical protein